MVGWVDDGGAVEVGCLVMAVGLLMMVAGCLMMVVGLLIMVPGCLMMVVGGSLMVVDLFDGGCGLVVDGGQVLVILGFVGFVRERTTVSERDAKKIIKNCKRMNILLYKCVE